MPITIARTNVKAVAFVGLRAASRFRHHAMRWGTSPRARPVEPTPSPKRDYVDGCGFGPLGGESFFTLSFKNEYPIVNEYQVCAL